MHRLLFQDRGDSMVDDEQRFGDGQDDYVRGAQKAAEAVKQFGAASAQTAGEATANAAAATVKAGVEGGKAAAEIAAGTAAGGPGVRCCRQHGHYATRCLRY